MSHESLPGDISPAGIVSNERTEDAASQKEPRRRSPGLNTLVSHLWRTSMVGVPGPPEAEQEAPSLTES